MTFKNNNWDQNEYFDVGELNWKKFSLSERDTEYSPSSVIDGNYQPFINKYISESEIARTVVQSKIHQYGNKKNQVIEITTFQKSDNELRPLLVFIHGGYWQELSIKESFFPSTEAVKNDIGYAAIEYSLAPSVSVSEIVDECTEAINWLFTNVADLGFDQKKIILSGSSAGAHLVAMSLLKINKFSPLGAVLVSGIYNIEPLIGTSIDEALSLTNSQAYENSPINFSLENFPPTIVTWGENETEQFKKQSKILVNKLIDEGVPVRSLEIEDKNHFDIILDLADLSKELGCELKMLLDK